MLGTPSLSSDYPAMRELCDSTNVLPIWFDPLAPEDLAAKLKEMVGRQSEKAAETINNKTQHFSASALADTYWATIGPFVNAERALNFRSSDS
jgi:hypothetical protein